MKRLASFLFTGISIYLATVILHSCRPEQEKRDFSKEIDSITNKWVPDKREGIFDAKIISRNGKVRATHVGIFIGNSLPKDCSSFQNIPGIIDTENGKKRFY